MRTLKIVWTLLVLLTFFAFALGHFKMINELLVAVLLVSTFLKGQLIIDYFMDLKEVSWKYRAIPSLWLVVVLGGIAWGYFS